MPRDADWSQASVNADGTLIVPLTGDHDTFLQMALVEAFAGLDGESWDQSWCRTQVTADALWIEGVGDETDRDRLREYVARAISKASNEAARLATEARELAEAGERDVAEGQERAQRLTDQFRNEA